jgi:hypothetical protein
MERQQMDQSYSPRNVNNGLKQGKWKLPNGLRCIGSEHEPASMPKHGEVDIDVVVVVEKENPYQLTHDCHVAQLKLCLALLERTAKNCK